jgi:hypothetical protein
MGRLREAVEEADRLRGERMVLASDFSYLDNRSNSFYRRLWIELHRVLRRGVPLSEWAGWD